MIGTDYQGVVVAVMNIVPLLIMGIMLRSSFRHHIRGEDIVSIRYLHIPPINNQELF